MNKKKQFRELEKQIFEQNADKRENEVILEDGDFRDGKLSWAGYSRLKDECEYVDYDDEIEIKMPAKYMDDFRCAIKSMATNELLHIRRDTRDNRIHALALFLVGVAILAVGVAIDSVIRQEIMFIVSWVFVWAASEKIFFDRNNLQSTRYNLLHIMTAKLLPDEVTE